MKKTFFFKLIPPRQTFHFLDMNEDERNIMFQHIAYWKKNMDEGKVIVFGPVLDPAGVYGMGIIQVDDEAAAIALA